MRRRPQEINTSPVNQNTSLERAIVKTGLVLSGGGSRAAYQVGAIKALAPYLIRDHQALTAVVGSSIGAINGLIIAACIKEGFAKTIEELESLWRERTFRNTFRGSPSMAFLRAIKMAVLQYLSPGPNKTSSAIFDPTPLMQRIDRVLDERGGLTPDTREPSLFAVGVMTTIEGAQRRPLLFLSCHQELDPSALQGASFDIFYTKSLSAKHGFASAALPSVLPPVELDLDGNKVRLVDG
jgi:NTE family protein